MKLIKAGRHKFYVVNLYLHFKVTLTEIKRMFTDCLEEVDIVVSFFRNLFIVIFHKKEKAIHNKKKYMYINQQRSLFQSRETIEGNVIDKCLSKTGQNL